MLFYLLNPSYSYQIFQIIFKCIQKYIMLTNLKKVEDLFYSNESIEEFLKNHSINDLIKMLNKSTKSETKTRIKQFFYKLIDSNSYKQFLLAGVNQSPEPKAQFKKYMISQNSEEYFQLLQKKVSDVVILLDSNITLTPLIFSLIYSPSFGIKMIKVFSTMYSKFANHEFLFSQQIKTELARGLQCEDTVVQMRFVQIIANIAIYGGKSFHFVKQALEKSLDIYNTEDILLKLNIVQVISVLGEGAETSQLLRGHKVWSKVQKDSMDPNQEFYVRKSLLILLVCMSLYEQYQITPKFTKTVIQFLAQCLKGTGQYLEAGLDLATCLLRSNEGIKILVQNSEVFGYYLKLSRSPQDNIKNLFIQNIISLTDKTNGKKTKPIVMNLVNCIGNPNLSNQMSHNTSSNNFMVAGIEPFCKWFVNLLQLPFQDLQIKLIGLFINLLQYSEICEELFQNQGSTKYILKPIGKSNTTKVLRGEKNRLVQRLLQKSNKEWKNTKLEQYVIMVEKELLKQKMQVEIAIEAD